MSWLLSLAVCVAVPGVVLGNLDFGVEVGARAPTLEGVDQHGKARSLGEWLGKGPVAVLFYRSGDW